MLACLLKVMNKTPTTKGPKNLLRILGETSLTVRCREVVDERNRFVDTPCSVSKFVASGWDYWSQFWVDFAAQGLPGVCSPADEFNWTEQDKLAGLVETLKMRLSTRSNEAWGYFRTHPLYPALESPPFAWAGCLLIHPKDSGIQVTDGGTYDDPDKILVLLSMANTYELGRLYALAFEGVAQKARNNANVQRSQAKSRARVKTQIEANEAIDRESFGGFNRPGRPLSPETLESWEDKVAGLDFLKAELWDRVRNTPVWLSELAYRLRLNPCAETHVIGHRFEEAAKAMAERRRSLSALPSLRS